MAPEVSLAGHPSHVKTNLLLEHYTPLTHTANMVSAMG